VPAMAENPDGQARHRPIARLARACRRYGKVAALQGVDLELRSGELLALLGPNGAGKTTAISLLLSLQRPDAGRAALFGRDPQDIVARRNIGVMLQHAQLPGTLRVGELPRLVASYYPDPRAAGAAAAPAAVDGLMRRSTCKLSCGQQR